MSIKETVIKEKCFTCYGTKLLSLGNGDYLECPDCNGTGTFLMVEKLFIPTAHSVMVPRRIE